MTISSHEKAQERVRKAIADAVAEYEKLQQNMLKVKAEFKLIEEGAFEVMEKFKNMQTVFEEKSQALQEMKKSHDALQKEVNIRRTGEIDLENHLEELKVCHYPLH